MYGIYSTLFIALLVAHHESKVDSQKTTDVLSQYQSNTEPFLTSLSYKSHARPP